MPNYLLAMNEDHEAVVQFLGRLGEELLGPVNLTFTSTGEMRALFQASDVARSTFPTQSGVVQLIRRRQTAASGLIFDSVGSQVAVSDIPLHGLRQPVLERHFGTKSDVIIEPRVGTCP